MSFPITFDLSGTAEDSQIMSFAYGALTLDISAGLFNGRAGEDLAVYEYTPILNMTEEGLGALNPYNDLEIGFDGDGKKEVAVFAFSHSVRIVEVGFTPLPNRFNGETTGVMFRIFNDGLVASATNTAIDYTDLVNDVAIEGTLLGIGAQGFYDHFRITHVKVELVGPLLQPDAVAVSNLAEPTMIDVLANDLAAETITAIDTTGIVGLVTIAADGLSLEYDSLGLFEALAPGETVVQNFTYTAQASDGLSRTETVTLTVVGEQRVITGTEGSDTLTGSQYADQIFGLSDDDLIYGGAGNDTIEGGAGADRIYGDAGDDSLDGGEGADSLYGGTGDDTLIGGDGDNLLFGAAGNDYLFGGAGKDLMGGGAGSDTLLGGADDDEIYGHDGDDLIDGGEGDDMLFGGNGSDTIHGGDGADRIWGGAGVDSLIGGAGDDQYWVDSPNDVVIEQAGEGIDRVNALSDYTLGAHVENLFLNGNRAVNGTGNELDNLITGNDAANVLSGLDGADFLRGLGGDDILDGGEGDDILSGGAGNDTLLGGAGNDQLYGNWGADLMQGGAGNDSYFVDNVGDIVQEEADSGTDEVFSSVSFTLAQHVENLTLRGSDDLAGYGNTGDNVLRGNDGANILIGYGGADVLEGFGGDDYLFSGMGADVVDGGDGNDTIIGGRGNDQLTGGSGADSFLFAEFGPVHSDTIVDFELGIDSIGLSLAAFGLTDAAFTSDLFGLGSVASTEAQRFVYDQAQGHFYFDADGSDTGAAQMVFSISAGIALSFDDLFAIA